MKGFPYIWFYVYVHIENLGVVYNIYTSDFH